MSKIFKVDYLKLVIQNLPTCLQQTRLAILEAALKPLQLLHYQLLVFRNEMQLMASYNSQVCYLRKMLNDRFDNTLRRIYLSEPVKRSFLWIYRQEEDKPVMLGEKMISRQDVITFSSEFTVNVPIELQHKEKEIISSVKFYKLPTKNFMIKYF